MARWSPECFAVWVWRKTNGRPARFIGRNRNGPFIWFTACQVQVADPGTEFAFDVTTFGMPVSRWGYRFLLTEGGTEVTEYWEDKRNLGATVLGADLHRQGFDHAAGGQPGGYAGQHCAA